ncbi:ABC transporter ATP-binding protein [bacterium]|nr:ABC transporter ATP-binding protein [candidate division CSSED10-310 bacterium]
MLSIENLMKRYGKRTVVDQLSLTVNRGELFAFLGPNGAGKTTTIKMMCGLLRPGGGHVVINGFDIVKNSRAAKASFGYIPDQPFLYDRLTPREFLRFIGGLYGIKPEDCDSRTEYWLDQFELLPFQDELIGSFSHGMRQKIAFTAAFIHNPPVLIVDEPMVGLDPRGAVILKKLLRQRCEAGLTAFVSTHSLDVAEQIADRIGIIHQGRLIAEGTMSELRDMTRQSNHRLESIFLELTRARDIGEIPVEALRQ